MENLMKKKVIRDEMYPVFYLEPEGYEYANEGVIDVPQDKLDWINRVSDEYYDTQMYIIRKLKEDSAG